MCDGTGSERALCPAANIAWSSVWPALRLEGAAGAGMVQSGGSLRGVCGKLIRHNFVLNSAL